MSTYRDLMIKKYGSEEAYKEEMSRRAKLVQKRPGGAFKNPEFAKEAGYKGHEKRWGYKKEG